VKIIRRGELRKLPTLHEDLICNTVREGLRNASKHVHAHLVLIHLCYSDREIRVAIQTESPGFQRPHLIAGRPGEVAIEEMHGCGLELLWRAARRLGGTLELELGDVGESLLTLRLPLHQFS
jgi:signal transduction histidine kinase